ncbi:hypothetical protein GCM10010417_15160 [Streptomyces carpaticus]
MPEWTEDVPSEAFTVVRAVEPRHPRATVRTVAVKSPFVRGSQGTDPIHRHAVLPRGAAEPPARPQLPYLPHQLSHRRQDQKVSEGTYAPHTSRSVSQTSPTVARARSASFIG